MPENSGFPSCCVLRRRAASAQEAYPSKPVTMVVAVSPWRRRRHRRGGRSRRGCTMRLKAAGRRHQPHRRRRRSRHGVRGQGSGRRLHAPDEPVVHLHLPRVGPHQRQAVGVRAEGFSRRSRLVTGGPDGAGGARRQQVTKTLQDFVDAAQANPGKINYSSSGRVRHACTWRWKIFANRRRHQAVPRAVPGRRGRAVTALLGGQVEALASGPAAAIGQIKGGKMRARSASWSDKRLQLLPELPTFRELGYDAEFLHLVRRVSCRLATPAPIVREAARRGAPRVASSAEFKSAMEKVGNAGGLPRRAGLPEILGSADARAPSSWRWKKNRQDRGEVGIRGQSPNLSFPLLLQPRQLLEQRPRAAGYCSSTPTRRFETGRARTTRLQVTSVHQREMAQLIEEVRRPSTRSSPR